MDSSLGLIPDQLMKFQNVLGKVYSRVASLSLDRVKDQLQINIGPPCIGHFVVPTIGLFGVVFEQDRLLQYLNLSAQAESTLSDL